MSKNKLRKINKANLFLIGGLIGFPLLMSAIDSLVLSGVDIARMFIPKLEDAHTISRRALRGYNLGGALDVAQTAAGQIASAVGMSTAVTDKAKLVREDIKGLVTNPAPSTSTDELLSKWAAWNPTEHISWKDLTNKGTGASMFTDMLSMSSLGAASGSNFGKIGAIAGGIGGMFTGLFGNLAAKRKAKKAADSINTMIDALNLSTQRTFANQAQTLDDLIVANELANFTGYPAAYGGPLYAFGGDLLTHGANFDTGITLIGNGGTHEENPNEGVPMGMDSQGIPNLVEEGEVIFNDYVFSKRLKVPLEMRKKYKLGGKLLTYADAALKMAKESEERPNDPISLNGLEDSMLKLMISLEELKLKRDSRKAKKYAKGGKMGRLYSGTEPFPQLLVLNDGTVLTGDPKDISWMNGINLSNDNITDSDWWKKEIEPIGSAPINPATTIASSGDLTSYLDKKDIPTETSNNLERKPRTGNKSNSGMDYLRLAPLFLKGWQAFKDAAGLDNRPDFALGRKIREANNQVRGIGTRAAGQMLGYKPTDEWKAINDFNALMAALRAAIRNAGNRTSSAGLLLASAYNQNRALGELYAGMEKANWDRLTQAIAHNTSVDLANRNAELQAAQADAVQGNVRANNLIAAAKADDAEESAYAQARAANRSGFFDALGAYGKERVDRKMLESLISSGLFGTPNLAMLEALSALGINPIKKAKGGKINKKRGLTY